MQYFMNLGFYEVLSKIVFVSVTLCYAKAFSNKKATLIFNKMVKVQKVKNNSSVNKNLNLFKAKATNVFHV